MKKFTKLTSSAIVLPQVNIDTDIIMPSQYLKVVTRAGLGKHAFESLRYNKDGTPKSDSPFEGARAKAAQIMVVGDNFGCGSSREHAPWGIADLGIRCLIGTSFADIFASNCVKNGILTVVLPQQELDRLMAAASVGQAITVDLLEQTVSVEAGDAGGDAASLFQFDYNPVHKHKMVNGLDEIAETLLSINAIEAFEAKQKAASPWLYRKVE